jgi:hypothetical protein
MAWKETLYERPLKRPIGDEDRAAIQNALNNPKVKFPMPSQIAWHAHKPELFIRSRFVSFIVRFTAERMIVDAELTLAAKMMATEANRREAVRLIEQIALELDL